MGVVLCTCGALSPPIPFTSLLMLTSIPLLLASFIALSQLAKGTKLAGALASVMCARCAANCAGVNCAAILAQRPPHKPLTLAPFVRRLPQYWQTGAGVATAGVATTAGVALRVCAIA